ncbi:MAG: DUF4328 domain-containing protein [Pseudomonadales bacterium]|jgi:uncharacterized membrane protein|nr:DUF4328 domain-containing protein [Pseudomonadales bacterium]
MSQTSQGDFKDTKGLTEWIKWSLYAYIAISVIAVISGTLERQLLLDFQNGVYSSQELAVAAATASDKRQTLVGFIQIFIFVVSGILILTWIYRANHNAYQLGAKKIRAVHKDEKQRG